MTQQTFDPKVAVPLSPREQDMLRTLRTHLHLNGEYTFTSDTFRMLGLDRFITDKKHGIGYFFLKLKQNGLSEATGKFVPSQLESNHGHRIQVWRMKP